MDTVRLDLVATVGGALRIRWYATLFALLVVVVLAYCGAASAQTTLTCAQTQDPNTPASPVPGQPCWTEVNPYPFVDPVTDLPLEVTSFAFRSWNRGLALTMPAEGGTTVYGLWRYNGTRWYPDPTFPGQGTCPGSTVLWAGKLDVWVIGGATLCRFDGVDYDWEPLSLPAGAGAITSGACFSWDNCWFFGRSGTVVHWDGQSLSNASTSIGSAPWLQGDYTAAVTATSAAGQQFGMAITNATENQPDGSPPPQVFASAGSTFVPAPFSFGLPTNDTTDLAAVAFDAQGDGWVAGNPAGTDLQNLFPGGSPAAPSPLVPISTSGAALPCATTPPTAFTYAADGSSDSFVWTSLGVLPGGTAIAGGLEGTAGDYQPVLAQVSCDGAPVITQFQALNPYTGTVGPADPLAYISAVAVSADNDAWAASSGDLPDLYQLTDGDTPNAPAGNDIESRPAPTTQEPTIFEFAPPVVVSPPPPAQTVIHKGKRRTKKVRLPAPIYSIGKPTVRAAGGSRFTLSISFRVRRKVRIGLEALRGRKVVSSSGIRTFHGRTGTLTVLLTRQDWPTGLKFVLPANQR